MEMKAMSDDVEKPVTGENAGAPPTKPASGDNDPSAFGVDPAVEETVGGVQGSPDDAEDAIGNVPVVPIGGPAPQPRVGGGEIEWSELGRQATIDGDGA
jgi:hypothetical protein